MGDFTSEIVLSALSFLKTNSIFN